MVANGFEWITHKYIWHGVHRKGKARYSPVPSSMGSHWQHHHQVRQMAFKDICYDEDIHHFRTRHEIASWVVVASVFGVGFYPWSKEMALATVYSAANDDFIHRRAHLDPEWAKRHSSWHYDHHMNRHQDANWCVTKPWFDYLLGTRVISSLDLKENNPFGLRLPKVISMYLNHLAESYFPVKQAHSVKDSVRQIDINAESLGLK